MGITDLRFSGKKENEGLTWLKDNHSRYVSARGQQCGVGILANSGSPEYALALDGWQDGCLL